MLWTSTTQNRTYSSDEVEGMIALLQLGQVLPTDEQLAAMPPSLKPCKPRPVERAPALEDPGLISAARILTGIQYQAHAILAKRKEDIDLGKRLERVRRSLLGSSLDD
jgi:hypothetical protein